jgi:hypothetical protein
MKTSSQEQGIRMTSSWSQRKSRRWLPLVRLAATVLVALHLFSNMAVAAGVDFCQRTSESAFRSCQAGAQSDYLLGLAKCDNLSDPAARKSCQQQALTDLQDAKQTCQDQFVARQVVCDRLGGAPYDPAIDPANFVTTIDNPYFPLTPGTTRIYVAHTAAGVIKNVVAATHNTVVILGVTCVEVHDVVFTNGEVTEDTLDWFAQDKEGNVWYFGENTREVAKGLTISVEGTFTAGIDGAKPGIIMEAHPAVSDFYRQEFVLGQGEDVEEVIGLNESVTVPYGSFDHCVKVQETTALEPGIIVHDSYAPGIGPVLSIDRPSNDRLELVQITTE